VCGERTLTDDNGRAAIHRPWHTNAAARFTGYTQP
jgi:hypothetical protein